MNYIARLQSENAALAARVKAMEDAAYDARTHLGLDKFRGAGNDWINVGDVDRLILNILFAEPAAKEDAATARAIAR